MLTIQVLLILAVGVVALFLLRASAGVAHLAIRRVLLVVFALVAMVSITPSGDPTLDQTALNAVQHIETFGPLPDAYQGSYVSAQYYFEAPPHP